MLATLAQYYCHIVRKQLCRDWVVSGQDIDHGPTFQVWRLLHKSNTSPHYCLSSITTHLLNAFQHLLGFFVELGQQLLEFLAFQLVEFPSLLLLSLRPMKSLQLMLNGCVDAVDG